MIKFIVVAQSTHIERGYFDHSEVRVAILLGATLQGYINSTDRWLNIPSELVDEGIEETSRSLYRAVFWETEE